MGYIAFEAERFEEARALNEEALTFARESGEQALQAEILTSLARIAVALAKREQAQDYVREALQLAWSVPYITLVLQALLVKGELLYKTGGADEAAKLFFLVKHHPAVTGVEKGAAQQFLDRLEHDLTAEQLTFAETFGQTVSLSRVVEALLERGVHRLSVT